MQNSSPRVMFLYQQKPRRKYYIMPTSLCTYSVCRVRSTRTEQIPRACEFWFYLNSLLRDDSIAGYALSISNREALRNGPLTKPSCNRITKHVRHQPGIKLLRQIHYSLLLLGDFTCVSPSKLRQTYRSTGGNK